MPRRTKQQRVDDRAAEAARCDAVLAPVLRRLWWQRNEGDYLPVVRLMCAADDALCLGGVVAPAPGGRGRHYCLGSCPARDPRSDRPLDAELECLRQAAELLLRRGTDALGKLLRGEVLSLT